MDDLNKSSLTHDVTSAVALWMDEKGFKPVETEVFMPYTTTSLDEKGWIADLAGVIFPTQTELINLKLIKKNPPYSFPIDGQEKWEPNPAYEVWSEELKTKQRLMTCLVEVKTTRGDFIGDRKWNLPLPTDMAFLAVPKGLVAPIEWPSGWGVLEFYDGSIRQKRAPVVGNTTVEQQRDVILNIAVRRDHHTRYARMKEWKQKERQATKLRRIGSTLTSLERAMIHIVKGECQSVEFALMVSGFYDPEPWMIEELKSIWGLAVNDK